MLCSTARPALSSPVRALTTDESDMVWIGSDKGDVRRLTMVVLAGKNELALQPQRFLRHTGAGTAERSIDAELGMLT